MNTVDTSSVPLAITRYFEAANRSDSAAVAACFTPDAVVRDEGHQHVGRAAIQTWISQASEKYQPRATVLNTREDEDKTNVRVRVEGQFPGSPIELNFQFSLRDGAIAQLEIQ